MKVNSLLKLELFILSSNFFSGCISGIPEGYVSLPTPTPIEKHWWEMTQQCKNAPNANFLATFRTDSIPSLNLEGAWSADLKTLNLQLLSPIGEGLAQIKMNDKGAEITTEKPITNVSLLLDFLTELGPLNLRLSMCGLHFANEPIKKIASFTQEKNDGLLLFSQQKLFIESSLKTKSSNLKVRTFWQSMQKEKLMIVNSVSQVFVGSIFEKQFAEVKWSGSFLQNGISKPKSLSIQTNGQSYNFGILEFD